MTADRLTRPLLTASRGERSIALPLLGKLPAFRTRLATELAELNYR